MDRTVARRLDRRTFIAASLGGIALPYLSKGARAQSAEKIVLPSFGGSYQDAMKAAFADPFTQETGISVVFSGVPDFARLKAQVLAGAQSWDVFEGPGPWLTSASQQGLLEPLDPGIMGDARNLPGAGKDYLPLYHAVFGVAWNESKRNASNSPRDFAQLWDTKTFPGRRTLRARADLTFEPALVADGVDPAKLYPLDVDRALKSLARIKPSVTKWAESTSQLTTLLGANEVDLGVHYNGRVKATIGTPAPLGMSLEQTCLQPEKIAVVKGSKVKQAAMKFVAFTARVDRQAHFTELMTYVPSNPAAMSMLSAETKKWIPDLSTGRHIMLNDDWWAKNYEEMQQKFQEFLLS